MTINERIRLYLPIIAALYDVDSQDLSRESLRHILSILLKTSAANADLFLEAIASISEDDPENPNTSDWIEQYLLSEEPNHKTI